LEQQKITKINCCQMIFPSRIGTGTFDQGMNMIYKSFFIAGILTALSASALAAPAPAAATQTPTNISGKNCAPVPATAQNTRDGVTGLDRGANNFDMDGLNNPCRLVDGSVDNNLQLDVDGSSPIQANARNANSQVNEYSNSDVAKTQNRFDAGALSMATNKSGKQLHAYQGQGLNETNLNTASSQSNLFSQGLNSANRGPIRAQDNLFDWESNNNADGWADAFNGRERNQPVSIESNPVRQAPGVLSGSVPGTTSPVSAVPEPATYLTMLAGLACLGIALGRKAVSTR
jgi:hypothetical protein